MLHIDDDYRSCVAASERVSWRLDDVFPPNARLDFARRFLPEALAPTAGLAFLDDATRRALNQLSANAYMNLFAFVEEYILATMVQHTQAELFGDPHNLRALLRFTDEELKHQELFARFRAAFDAGFGGVAKVLDNRVAIAEAITKQAPIAVMILTLHIELMTQLHYTAAVKDDVDIDPLARSLLKHHWLEEAHHARIDTLELAKLVNHAAQADVDAAVDGYLALVGDIDALLAAQAKLDATALAQRRPLTPDEWSAVVDNQHRGYRLTFALAGMTHPTFVDVLGQISPKGAAAVAGAAAELA